MVGRFASDCRAGGGARGSRDGPLRRRPRRPGPGGTVMRPVGVSASSGAERFEQGGQFIGGEAVLGLFLGELDLDEHGQPLPGAHAACVHPLGDLERVDRVDGVEDSAAGAVLLDCNGPMRWIWRSGRAPVPGCFVRHAWTPFRRRGAVRRRRPRAATRQGALCLRPSARLRRADDWRGCRLRRFGVRTRARFSVMDMRGCFVVFGAEN